MANTRYSLKNAQGLLLASTAGANYQVGDTAAGLAAGNEGDIAYAKDTDALYTYSGAAWVALSSVAGSDTQVIFNDGGAFGGDAGLVYDKTTDTLTLAGQLIISGASAGQIVFPGTQNASTNVNTLDDYEEGTWPPVLGGAGGTSGQAYTTQVGYYVKVGKLVTVWWNITLSTEGTITGGLEIQGLPFTIENVSNNYPQANMGYWQSLAVAYVHVSGFGNVNSTTISIFGATAAATGLTQLTAADVNDTTQLIGSLSYKASS